MTSCNRDICVISANRHDWQKMVASGERKKFFKSFADLEIAMRFTVLTNGARRNEIISARRMKRTKKGGKRKEREGNGEKLERRDYFASNYLTQERYSACPWYASLKSTFLICNQSPRPRLYNWINGTRKMDCADIGNEAPSRIPVLHESAQPRVTLTNDRFDLYLPILLLWMIIGTTSDALESAHSHNPVSRNRNSAVIGARSLLRREPNYSRTGICIGMYDIPIHGSITLKIAAGDTRKTVSLIVCPPAHATLAIDLFAPTSSEVRERKHNRCRGFIFTACEGCSVYYARR